MSQSPNQAAPQRVAPLLALATKFLRAGDQPMRSHRVSLATALSLINGERGFVFAPAECLEQIAQQGAVSRMV